MLFLIVATVCFLFLRIEQQKYDKALAEKQKIENGLGTAIRQTAQRVAGVMQESAEMRKRVVEQEFFQALYIELDIIDQKEEQEKIRRYVPLIVLVEEDGAYFLYWKPVMQAGTVEYQQEWTEKIEFPEIQEGNEEKTRVVAELLEQYASDMITEHNDIAGQFGLEYTLTVPRFLQNTLETLEFPMLFAVVQGWPLTVSGDLLYENCVDAGVYLQEVERYVVEFPANLQDTRSYYHRKDCEVVSQYERSPVDTVSKEEAVVNFGAFPCEKCILTGLEMQ